MVAVAGSPVPIQRARAVEVFGNRYGRLYDDEVISPDGETGRYLRWQWDHDGVVIVPRQGDKFALVAMYRSARSGATRSRRRRSSIATSAALAPSYTCASSRTTNCQWPP